MVSQEDLELLIRLGVGGARNRPDSSYTLVSQGATSSAHLTDDPRLETEADIVEFYNPTERILLKSKRVIRIARHISGASGRRFRVVNTNGYMSYPGTQRMLGLVKEGNDPGLSPRVRKIIDAVWNEKGETDPTHKYGGNGRSSSERRRHATSLRVLYAAPEEPEEQTSQALQKETLDCAVTEAMRELGFEGEDVGGIIKEATKGLQHEGLPIRSAAQTAAAMWAFSLEGEPAADAIIFLSQQRGLSAYSAARLVAETYMHTSF